MADAGKRTKAVTAGKVKQQGVKLGGDLKFQKNAKFLDARVEIWDTMFKKQQEVYKKFPQKDIKITMPDGTVKSGKSFVTSPYDVAKGISS